MLAALTGEQTVIGIHHDLIFFCSTFVFHGLSDRPSHTFSPLAALLHYPDDTFHVPGLVISLVTDLCVCQRAVVTEGLQGSRADLQQQAHLLVVQPFLLLYVAVQPAEGVQPVRERPEGREHRLEGPCLNVHYFHNHCNFRFDICFILSSDPDSVPQFSESQRNILNFKTG